MTRQVAFYRDVLGLRVVERDGDSFVRSKTPGASLALHASAKPEPPPSPARLSFMTHDVVARRKELLQQKVDMGPIRHPAPGVLVTDGRDPEGNVFHVETRVDAGSITPDVESEARAVFDAMVDAYHGKDWEGYLGLYSDDPSFHLYEKGRALYASKEEVREAIQAFYPSVSEASFRPSSRRVIAVSNRLALLTTEFEQSLMLRDGGPIEVSGTLHLLLRRETGGFRILTGDTISRE